MIKPTHLAILEKILDLILMFSKKHQENKREKDIENIKSDVADEWSRRFGVQSDGKDG